VATILDDDAPSLSTRELVHGSGETQDLAAEAGLADVDYYRMAQEREAPTRWWWTPCRDVQPLVLERLAADNTTVLQSSVAVGTVRVEACAAESASGSDAERAHPGAERGLHDGVWARGRVPDPDAGDDLLDSALQFFGVAGDGSAPAESDELLDQRTVYFWRGTGALLYSHSFSLGPRRCSP